MIRRPPRSTLFPYTRSSDLRVSHAEDRLCLVAAEPGAVDLLLEHPWVGSGVILRRPVLREQGGGHHVHTGVGGLRRQNRGDQQLERIAVLERAYRVGICLLEARDDLLQPRAEPSRGFLAPLAQRSASGPRSGADSPLSHVAGT